MDTIPELLNLTNDELEDLLNCDEKLDAFIETLPDSIAISSKCQSLTEENYNLASKWNIQLIF